MFVIATAGVPIAVSKMVAERQARRQFAESGKIFRTALVSLGFVGFLGSAFLMIFAQNLANFLGSPDSAFAIIMIAPAIFFVSLVSVFRGYFQGAQNMYPTAMSEIVESLTRLVVGLIFAMFIMKMSVDSNLGSGINLWRRIVGNEASKLNFAAGGAILGATCGTFFALITLTTTYLFTKKSKLSIIGAHILQTREILRELFAIAIPVTIGASVSSLTSVVDLATIMNGLVKNPVVLDRYGALFAEGSRFCETVVARVTNGALFAKEILAAKANFLYGMYSGYAIPLFNVPLTIVVALAMCVVPAISGEIAKKNHIGAQKLTESALRITMLFSAPCAFGMMTLARPILAMIFMGDADAASLLRKLSMSIIFVSLVSVSNAILQGLGNLYVPVVNMLIGGIIKVTMNYYFIPVYGIDAAPISTCICYSIIAILNLHFIFKNAKIHMKISDFLTPIASAGVMAFLSKIVFIKIQQFGIMRGQKIFSFDVTLIFSLSAAIFASAIIYILLVFLAGGIRREDVEMLPFGKKIANIFIKSKLLKN
jgi:stage V sporulation protein B